MKSYEDRILNGGSVSQAYEEWASDREQQLLTVCRSRTAPMEDVRAAQAKLEEIKSLQELRATLRKRSEMGGTP